MGIFEVALMASVIVGITSAFAGVVALRRAQTTMRGAEQKNRAAEQKLGTADQKYRQEREARLSSEDALRRAEEEYRQAEIKLQEAHNELTTAANIREQAEHQVRDALQAKMQAEHERSSAIQAKEIAEENTRTATERMQIALRAQELAESERDEAIARMCQADARTSQLEDETRLAKQAREQAERERDEAIQVRKITEENSRRAIQDKFTADERAREFEEFARLADENTRNAEQECDGAKARARLADERAQNAEQARTVAGQERDAAIEQARQANERAQNAEQVRATVERERDTAILAKEQAERERDEAIQARKVVEENSCRAIQDKFDAVVRAEETGNSRDAAIKRAEEAKQERDEAIKHVEQADARARLVEQAQKQAEKDRDTAKDDARQANERAKNAEQQRDEAIGQARLADERVQKAEQALAIAEQERDATDERANQAEKERDDAKKQARLADERAEKATEHAEKAEKEVDESKKASTSTNVVSPEPSPIPESLSEQETRNNEHVPSNDDGERESPKRTTPIADHKGARSTSPQFHTASTPRSPKPEIICVQKQSEWILKVELPQELLDGYSNLRVFQNELQLDGVDGYWKLNDACGNLVVRSDGGIVWQTDLGERAEQPLLFKLSGDREQGHRVRTVTQGWYLLIVPEDWKHEGLEPEFVSIRGYHAYCRFVDDCRGISFQRANEKSIAVTPHVAQFDLIGKHLPDANEKRGLVFGETLPYIRATSQNTWHMVETIVVGEEGRNRKEWKSKKIALDKSKVEQELPSEIAQWQTSWFFVRFYDANDELIESTDFRLARGLSNIQINQVSPLPPETGHSAASVEFHHAPDCHIEQLSGVEIETDGCMTLAEIPPRPESDQTNWRVTAQGYEPIDVTILVERIWWAIGTKEKMPLDSEWVDEPLPLTREDFINVTDKSLWVRLPKPRWPHAVQVGFTQETAKPIPVKVTEQTGYKQLNDFYDSVPRQNDRSRFFIWVDGSDAPLAYVRVQVKCCECGERSDSETDIFVHIESRHLNTLFRPLTDEERHRRESLLPIPWYCCANCNHYFGSSAQDPTCPRCKSNQISPQITHLGIRMDDEIRKNSSSHLAEIVKCHLCQKEFALPNSNQCIDHLKTKHKTELYKIC